MLAVITLYYFPRLGLGFSYLLITLSKCYLLTIFLIFLAHLYYHHYFHCCHFILFFATNIVITSVVTISAFFSFLLVCFVSYLYMWWTCSMSATKKLPGSFFIFVTYFGHIYCAMLQV